MTEDACNGDARKLELEAQLDAVNANIREISGKLDESAAREHDLETKLAAVEPSIARANEELTRVREAHAAAKQAEQDVVNASDGVSNLQHKQSQLSRLVQSMVKQSKQQASLRV